MARQKFVQTSYQDQNLVNVQDVTRKTLSKSEKRDHKPYNRQGRKQ